MLIGQGQD
jgi:hypothetical protein